MGLAIYGTLYLEALNVLLLQNGDSKAVVSG